MATRHVQLFTPSPPVPFVSYTWVAPQGRVFGVELSWNGRAGWYFSLRDENGEVILAPRRLRVGVDLLALAYDERAPGGVLAPVPSDGDLHSRISFEDLGSRVFLVYRYEVEE